MASANDAKAAETDERLERAVGLVRVMSSAQLKEQCLRTEWASLETELERDLLCQVVSERAFWDDVKEVANDDMQDGAADVGDDDVDVDQRMLQMFKIFDKDGSGAIDATELHQMLLYMGITITDADVREIIAGVSSDGEGINSDEFLHVMKVVLPQRTAGGPSALPAPAGSGGSTASSAAASSGPPAGTQRAGAASSAKQNMDAQAEIRAANAERDSLAARTNEASSAAAAAH